jgi:hypothetical protein
MGTSSGSALRFWSTYCVWEFKNANSDVSTPIGSGGPLAWMLTGTYIQFPDGTKQYTAGGGGGTTFAKGSAGVAVTTSGGYVDVTTGLASVSGALSTLDYDLNGSDFVTTTVRPNVPSAGKLRIWAKKIAGGTSNLTVYWVAW